MITLSIKIKARIAVRALLTKRSLVSFNFFTIMIQFPMAKTITTTVYKSAKTGEFVTKQYVKTHPATTYTQTVKKKV